MTFATRFSLLAFAATTAFSGVTPAFAQDIEAEEAVPILGRQAREQRASEALVTASVYGEAGVKYIDNIYRSPSNEDSDFVGVLRPGVLLRSQDEGVKLRARGEVERGQYFSETRNNYTDADFRADGDVAANEWLNLNARARYRFDHVAIGAFIDDPDRRALEPTLYRYAELGAGGTARQSDFRFDLDAQYSMFDYDNTDAALSQTIINEDRNRDQYQLSARPGYYVMPDILAYVQGTVNWREYDKMIDGTALHSLDSEGYEAVVGIEKGSRDSEYYVNANVGYLEQDYDDDFRKDIDGLAANMDLQWDASETLTLTGILSRSVEEATLTDASGYLRTRIGAGAEYRINRDWSAAGLVRYTNYDFEINTTNGRPDREDDVFDLNLGVIYDITDIYHTGLEYGFITRDSDDTSVEYDANTVMLRLFASY